MEKLVYTLWRTPDTDPTAIGERVLRDATPPLLELGVRGLRVNVEDPAGAILQQGSRPSGERLCATVSVWLDSVDERASYETAIREAAGVACVDGYLVTESVPRAYGEHRTWPDGERSPGISIMTVFDKRADVDDEDFFRIWHTEHTPLSFDIHPIWLYVRNSVTRSLTPDALPAKGIVYEAVPTLDDLVDLHRFFGSDGSDESLGRQMTRVMEHMATFADVDGLVVSPAAEYVFRTLST
jgi:hypothetical protein